MKIELTESFLEDLWNLPARLRTKCRERMTKLQRASTLSKLPSGWHLEKLVSSPFCSLRIDGGYRMTFTREGDRITFRHAGTHDEGYSKDAIRDDKKPAIAELAGSAPSESRPTAARQPIRVPSERERVRVAEEFRANVSYELGLGKITESDEERRWLLLDEEQFRCIDDFLVHNPRALVTGGAGTGKTLVAAEAARRSGEAGKRVLLLCFTEALAHWLRSQIGDRKTEVWPIKRFAVFLLEYAAGGKIEVPDRFSPGYVPFFRSVMPRALAEAREAIRNLDFDTIIVDEAQDFDADDWKLIEHFSHPDRHGDVQLWVFCDPSQTLWPDRTIPSAGFAKYLLRNQYRCHEEIDALAALYESAAGQPPPDPAQRVFQPAGATDRRIALIRCPARSDVSRAVVQEINRCLAAGVHRSDIAIISLVGRTTPEAFAGLDELNGLALVRADDDRIKDEVVADSVYRFKGLERPVAILTDLSLRGPESEQARRVKMYVAITRAQSFLRIIDTGEAMSREPELNRLFR